MVEHSDISTSTARFMTIAGTVGIAALVVLSAMWMNLDVPYLAFAASSAFLFHLRSKPGWRELLLAAAVAIILGSLRLIFFGSPHGWVGFVFAMAGLASFLVLGTRAVMVRDEERKRLLGLIGPALGLVFFIFSAQRALNLADYLYPKTFDLYLYLFDGSFGFQPSFAIGRWFAQSAILAAIGSLAYQTLPLVMALIYAAHVDPKSGKPVWYLLELFFMAGFLGWALYNFVPGTGPGYAFAGLFPYRVLPYKVLHRVLLERIVVGPAFPRNAIPSLHVAWVLLLWWSCRQFSFWIRGAAFLYLLLTLFATMGTGEHYMIDLVTAFPFAMMVESLCHSAIPMRKRLVPLITGFALTLTWMSLVRFGVPWMLKSPVIPWSLTVVGTATVLWMENRWLNAATIPASKPVAEDDEHLVAAAGA